MTKWPLNMTRQPFTYDCVHMVIYLPKQKMQNLPNTDETGSTRDMLAATL